MQYMILLGLQATKATTVERELGGTNETVSQIQSLNGGAC